MKQEAHSNTALFLMELIMVIGFFSLVSTVCMQLFAAASRTSTQSVRINHAVRLTESLAETWIAKDGDLNELARLYPGSTIRTQADDPRTGTLTLAYDKDWTMTTEAADCEYTITVAGSVTDAASLYSAEIPGGIAVQASITALAADGTEICSLQPDHYVCPEAADQGGTTP